MFGLGFQEILLLLLLALLLFGAKKLPDIGRAVGKAIREFRQAFHTGDADQSGGARKEHGEDAGPKD